MHHNKEDGQLADDHCVVNLHGAKTDIYSNEKTGICAMRVGTVNIHLPSQHNTSHDNRERDQEQYEIVPLYQRMIQNVNSDDD